MKTKAIIKPRNSSLGRLFNAAIITPLFIVASVVLSFAPVQFASAASVTWTGDGSDNKFSTAENWSTDQVPENGDSVIFDNSAISEATTIDVDVSNLSLSGITFNRTAGVEHRFTMTGNTITLTGDVNSTGSPFAAPIINNNINLGANITISGVQLGNHDSINTINLGSYALNYAGSSECGLNVYGAISGSGALTLSGSNQNIRGNNASYSGNILVTGKAMVSIASFGTSAGGTTVSGSGELWAVTNSSASISEPFTFGGSGHFGVTTGYYSCMGGGVEPITLTLTGGVTLTSNFKYGNQYTTDNLVVQGPYTTNGYTFSVASGSSATLQTPEGESEAPTETINLEGEGDPDEIVTIGNKQTGVLTGSRNTVSVMAGGILKGTGTANNISVGSSGVIAPGNSPGTITVLNSFLLNGAYSAELLNKDTYDQLIVGENYSESSSAVALYPDSILEVILYDGWSIEQGDEFMIIDNRSNTDVQGTFDGLEEGAQFTIQGITFSITYEGGDGNDVVLTALKSGTDPGAPNTGFIAASLANPVLIAVLGAITASLIFALSRRKSTN